MQDIGPSLAASLEPLAHPLNVASLSLFHQGIIPDLIETI